MSTMIPTVIPSVPMKDDVDPVETREWLDALASVLEREGPERARFLLDTLTAAAQQAGLGTPASAIHTPYANTLPPSAEPPMPGDRELEERILRLLRWNAAAMVVRANRDYSGVGGHMASFASVAQLFEVGFNHFWRGDDGTQRGDLIFFQGHSSPGIYARAFLEGRLDEDHLLRFRREVEPGGLSSYPHPWLMPDFWQFPTVSMGLGPITAIYQARFMKYLQLRGLTEAAGRKVWCFIGDGETDEVETLGALSIAAREQLDNLVFVINCNLQRLDGPVRGNGKIVQELEGIFRGAGWNVIKLIWSSAWDPLLAADHDGKLQARLDQVLDGEYQNYASRDGAYMRENLFAGLQDRVAHLSDEQLRQLLPGGHDPQKIYAAYHAAVHHQGQPTLILAHTIKGYGLGSAGEGLNIAHQQKKMTPEELEAFQQRFSFPLSDGQIQALELYRPPADSPEMRYLHARRQALGGYLPRRRADAPRLEIPALEAFDVLLKGTSGDREMSTTMAFVRFLAVLTRDPQLKPQLVPILADEARTFGLEGMFRQLGIYSPLGQLYTPVDADQLSFYKEAKDGQILQDGINEAGAFSSWLAAGTAYANHGLPMIPFFIYYSMFGFQRIGDLAWAAGDLRARGFLLGGTSGRTTLNGEGLQHEDGHSHLLASTYPTCRAYDPTFAYEVAVLLRQGLREMYTEQQDCFYYLTLLNENYSQPAMPEGVEEGIVRGLYRFQAAPGRRKKLRVQLLGCGSILREVLAAAELLALDFDVLADVWSATSFNQLRRDGMEVERWNRLHPTAEPKKAYVTECLDGAPGPVIAATDHMRAFADQIRAWVPGRYVVLGTDGFGRSDTRAELRRFFEVNRYYIAAAALKALADEGQLSAATVQQAMERYGLDPEKPDPMTS